MAPNDKNLQPSLLPSVILYSQGSISNKFSDGRLIGELLDDLYYGRCFASAIEIEVSRIQGHWVSADNRRLWVLKQLEKLGRFNTRVRVKVKKTVFKGKLTSTSKGKTVTIRNGHPGGVVYDMLLEKERQQLEIEAAKQTKVCVDSKKALKKKKNDKSDTVCSEKTTGAFDTKVCSVFAKKVETTTANSTEKVGKAKKKSVKNAGINSSESTKKAMKVNAKPKNVKKVVVSKVNNVTKAKKKSTKDPEINSNQSTKTTRKVNAEPENAQKVIASNVNNAGKVEASSTRKMSSKKKKAEKAVSKDEKATCGDILPTNKTCTNVGQKLKQDTTVPSVPDIRKRNAVKTPSAVCSVIAHWREECQYNIESSLSKSQSLKQPLQLNTKPNMATNETAIKQTNERASSAISCSGISEPKKTKKKKKNGAKCDSEVPTFPKAEVKLQQDIPSSSMPDARHTNKLQDVHDPHLVITRDGEENQGVCENSSDKNQLSTKCIHMNGTPNHATMDKIPNIIGKDEVSGYCPRIIKPKKKKKKKKTKKNTKSDPLVAIDIWAANSAKNTSMLAEEPYIKSEASKPHTKSTDTWSSILFANIAKSNAEPTSNITQRFTVTNQPATEDLGSSHFDTQCGLLPAVNTDLKMVEATCPDIHDATNHIGQCIEKDISSKYCQFVESIDRPCMVDGKDSSVVCNDSIDFVGGDDNKHGNLEPGNRSVKKKRNRKRRARKKRGDANVLSNTARDLEQEFEKDSGTIDYFSKFVSKNINDDPSDGFVELSDDGAGKIQIERNTIDNITADASDSSDCDAQYTYSTTGYSKLFDDFDDGYGFFAGVQVNPIKKRLLIDSLQYPNESNSFHDISSEDRTDEDFSACSDTDELENPDMVLGTSRLFNDRKFMRSFQSPVKFDPFFKGHNEHVTDEDSDASGNVDEFDKTWMAPRFSKTFKQGALTDPFQFPRNVHTFQEAYSGSISHDDSDTFSDIAASSDIDEFSDNDELEEQCMSSESTMPLNGEYINQSQFSKKLTLFPQTCSTISSDIDSYVYINNDKLANPFSLPRPLANPQKTKDPSVDSLVLLKSCHGVVEQSHASGDLTVCNDARSTPKSSRDIEASTSLVSSPEYDSMACVTGKEQGSRRTSASSIALSLFRKCFRHVVSFCSCFSGCDSMDQNWSTFM